MPRHRREELREQEWKYAQELLNKAKQMLVFPLATTVRSTQEDGKTIVTEYHPARWSLADVGRMLETASKLARLAMGEETERVGVNARMIEITGDDLARAARESEQWERKMYGDTGVDPPAPEIQRETDI